MNIKYKKKRSKLKDINFLDIDTYKNYTDTQSLLLLNRLTPDIIGKNSSINIEDYKNTKLDLDTGVDKIPDMVKASKELAKAIRTKKHIVVVTDFDADGLSGAATMALWFRDILNYTDYKVIHNIKSYGRGVNLTLVEEIIELHKVKPIDYIVTVDHGSSDESSYKMLKKAGIKNIIVTDHHEVPVDNYPKSAKYVVNSMRADKPLDSVVIDTFRKISGCTVAYLLCREVSKNLKNIDMDKLDIRLLPFAALTTISDVMPLNIPFNRNIVKRGLRIINSFAIQWIAFKKLLNISDIVNAKDIAFSYAPIINTGNRMGVEKEVFEFLTTSKLSTVMSIGEKLISTNTKRKSITRSILNKVRTTYKLDTEISNILMIDTPYGINGIVAGNIGDEYNRPCVCFMDTGNGELTGSGRGILPEVDLEAIFRYVKNDSDIVIKYGGHKQAAGITIKEGTLDEFKRLFNLHLSKQIKKSSKNRVIEFDSRVNIDNITPIFLEEINRLEPYGKDWEQPVFLTKARLYSVNTYGSLLKIRFCKSGKNTLAAMHFIKGVNSITVEDINTKLKPGNVVNVVYTLDISKYMGASKLNMNIIHIGAVDV